MTILAEPLAGLRRVNPSVLGPALLGCGLLVAVAGYLGPGLAALAVGAPLALAAAVLLSARPLAVLLLMVAVEVSNATNVLESHVPRIFHASLALGLLALVRLLVTSQDARRAVRSGLPVAGGLLGVHLLGQLLAVTVSERPDTSASGLARSAVDVLFILVLTALAVAVRRPWTLAAVVAGTLAGLGALGVLNQLAFHGAATFGGFATVSDASGELITTIRHAGPLPDSNFWGRHLVLGLPLAAALLTRALRAARRPAAAGWAVATVAMLGSVYLTQSRGTFVAALVALLGWLAASGTTVRRRALPALALALPLLLLPGIGDRFVALAGDLTDRTAGYAADPSVLGRAAAQEIAWAMFTGKPIFGVGPAAYTELVPQFAGIVPTAVLEPTDAPHNLYLQAAAESGIVGLAAWLLMFGGFCVLAGWAAVRFGRVGLPAAAERPLAAAVLAGLLAWAAASAFLHLAYFRTLGVAFALAVAVFAGARAAGPAGSAAVAPRPARVRRPLAVAAVAVAAGTGGLLLALGHLGQPAVTATQLVTLAPTVDPYAWNAYSYDVRSRVELVPTYAALAVDPRGDSVTAEPDPVRGTVRISVRAVDDTAARQRLGAVLAEANQRIRSFGADRAYTLAPVGAVESRSTPQRSAGEWLLAAGAAGAGALGPAGALALIGAGRRRRRADVPTAAAPAAAARRRPIVLVEFSPSGGLFQFAVQLGDALAAAGHRVELLTGPRPELAPATAGFRIRPVLPTWHPGGDAAPLPRPRRLVRRAGRAGRLVLAWGVLAGQLLRLRPRAVLWSYWRFTFEPLFVVAIARLLRPAGAGGPVLGIVAHEPLPKSDARDTSTPKQGVLLNRAFAAAWRRMDLVFTLGERTRQVVLAHWAPAGPVLVIPHGDERALLDGPVPAVEDTEPEVLFFGTWTSYKGVELLLEAFALVRSAMPEARLTLAGDVSADLDLPAVLARAAAIGGVSARPGYVPVPEVPELLGRTRVVAVPYVRASQSGVAHLAYTFGRPVVGTDVGDLPAVIKDGRTGVLVPPNDPVALAAALHGLLADPARAAALGAAGRESMRARWEQAASTIGHAVDAAERNRR